MEKNDKISIFDTSDAQSVPLKHVPANFPRGIFQYVVAEIILHMSLQVVSKVNS
jgi:hypothetical protein